MDQPHAVNLKAIALSVATCIVLCTTMLMLSFKLQPRKEPDVKTTVAQALIDPRVRSCQMYFKARDPDAEADAPPSLYRLHSDPTQTLLGGAAWTVLQKYVKGRAQGGQSYWYAVGGIASIDWLPEEAELVERTKEMP